MKPRFKQEIPQLTTSTPRCFPDWMRRLNPFFKKEDENAFFEMMVRTQLVHKNRKISITLSYLITIAFSFGSYFALSYSWKLFLVLLGFFLVDLFYFRKLRKNSVSSKEFTPKLLNVETFFLQADKELLKDLWVSPIRTKELIEGLLLSTGRTIRPNLILAASPFLFQCYMIYLISPPLFSLSAVVHLLALSTGIYFGYQAATYMISNFPFNGYQWVDRVTKLLLPPEPLGLEDTQRYNKISKFYSEFNANYKNTIAVSICFFVIFVQPPSNPTASFTGIYGSLPYFAMSVYFIAWGLYLQKTRKTKWNKGMRRLKTITDVLSELYPSYFRRACFNEEEAPQTISPPHPSEEPANPS